jgi:pyridoxamine 5'-phosphate oxidase
MRFVRDNYKELDWEKKRLEVFSNMSTHMRAAWCRPPPGEPFKTDNPEEEWKDWPVSVDLPAIDGSEENMKNWEFAFGNFALMVVDPEFVDWVDMDVKPNRRWQLWRKEDGTWDEREVVP